MVEKPFGPEDAARFKIEYEQSRRQNDNGTDRSAQPPRQLKTVAQFFNEYVPMNYIIEPIIDAGGLYTLTGKTGACKTAFLILASIALACERSDLLRNTIEPGRVAFLTCENPRNLRMRMMASFGELGIDPELIGDALLIQDWFGKPDEMLASLKLHEKDGPFKLIVIDTLASFFPGDNSNDNAQVMEFLRGVRPMSELKGSPAVVIAAHPVKNASEDNLVPYGGGAILNEVDGNLTMSLETGSRVMLHWQGKIRGVEFDPLSFELREITSALVRDTKGNPFKLPFLECSDQQKAADNVRAEGSRRIQVLTEIAKNPNQTHRQLCEKLSVVKGTMSKWLKDFEARKWVTKTAREGYRITPKGKAELDSDRRDIDPKGAPM
ncbi:hypothetical protein AMST5_02158 [freshwater sediment metagenome]|uniref:HVO-A0261-like N-terminal domain-containing protein n=1 Tax=freshwater sediment metagenome TaxID=556182 RepID=A0AA48RE98_9ZZZZ